MVGLFFNKQAQPAALHLGLKVPSDYVQLTCGRKGRRSSSSRTTPASEASPTDASTYWTGASRATCAGGRMRQRAKRPRRRAESASIPVPKPLKCSNNARSVSSLAFSPPFFALRISAIFFGGFQAEKLAKNQFAARIVQMLHRSYHHPGPRVHAVADTHGRAAYATRAAPALFLLAEKHVLGGNILVPVLDLLDGFPLRLCARVVDFRERGASIERKVADFRHAPGDDDGRE